MSASISPVVPLNPFPSPTTIPHSLLSSLGLSYRRLHCLSPSPSLVGFRWDLSKRPICLSLDGITCSAPPPPRRSTNEREGGRRLWLRYRNHVCWVSALGYCLTTYGFLSRLFITHVFLLSRVLQSISFLMLVLIHHFNQHNSVPSTRFQSIIIKTCRVSRVGSAARGRKIAAAKS